MAITSPDGSFELRQLGDGPYRVSVTPPGDYLPSEPVDVRGGSKDVVVRVPAAAIGVLTVRDWNGVPVRGAVIDVHAVNAAVQTKDGQTAAPVTLAHVVTDADGKAKVNGIAPGTECSVVVREPSSRDDLAQWSASPWTPHDTEVVLERAYPIRGVVVDANGRAVRYATVWIATDSGEPGEMQCNDAGRFAIPELRKGETRRLCGGGSFDYIPPRTPTWTTVSAGNTDVRLVAQRSE
jgi:hypothetical protein